MIRPLDNGRLIDTELVAGSRRRHGEELPVVGPVGVTTVRNISGLLAEFDFVESLQCRRCQQDGFPGGTKFEIGMEPFLLGVIIGPDQKESSGRYGRIGEGPLGNIGDIITQVVTTQGNRTTGHIVYFDPVIILTVLVGDDVVVVRHKFIDRQRSRAGTGYRGGVVLILRPRRGENAHVAVLRIHVVLQVAVFDRYRNTIHTITRSPVIVSAVVIHLHALEGGIDTLTIPEHHRAGVTDIGREVHGRTGRDRPGRIGYIGYGRRSARVERQTSQIRSPTVHQFSDSDRSTGSSRSSGSSATNRAVEIIDKIRIAVKFMRVGLHLGVNYGLNFQPSRFETITQEILVNHRLHVSQIHFLVCRIRQDVVYNGIIAVAQIEQRVQLLHLCF